MNILDLSLSVPMESQMTVRRYFPENPPEASREAILKEHLLGVQINGQLVARLVCTPSHLIELVLGRLLTEGGITGTNDVSAITLSRGAEFINVEMSEKCASFSKGEVDLFVSTGNALNFGGDRREPLMPVSTLPWSASQVFNAIKAFEEDSPLHKATNCVHSCYLFENDTVKYCCEDIGRHNAFDKVIGCAMCDGVDLRNTFVFTSGRVPLDMVTKAIRAGIPMLVSKAAPTDLTVRKANENGLTLVGLAHSDSFSLYTDMPIAWV